MTLLDPPMSLPAVGSNRSRPQLRCGLSIDPPDFEHIRRRMCLDFCKWDPQVGDVATLASFPLLLSHAAWSDLSAAAEALAAETLELERSLIARPDLHAQLGLPPRLRGVMPRVPSLTSARVMRFDFHFTVDDGWQVSEVNSDVPGGFTESSAFPRLMADYIPDAQPAGDPAAAYVDAVIEATRHRPGSIALLWAPGFMEDHQIVSYLATLLRARGVTTHLTQPRNLAWRNDGEAYLNGPVAGIIRFYQGEWLSRLRRTSGWQNLFTSWGTPVANPGLAILSESKRLPLLFDRLGLPLRAWRKLLPETRDPRDAPWHSDERWLLKAAFSNTGDAVLSCDTTPRRQWLATQIDAVLRPRSWVAQRRFETLPIDTPIGLRYPCVGVYVVNGQACGAYGRLAPTPIVRYDATDVAVLVEKEGSSR